MIFYHIELLLNYHWALIVKDIINCSNILSFVHTTNVQRDSIIDGVQIQILNSELAKVSEWNLILTN